MTKLMRLATSGLPQVAIVLCGVSLLAQVASPKVTFNRAAAFDVSPPLRDLRSFSTRLRYDYHLPDEPRSMRVSSSKQQPIGDPVEQRAAGSPVSASIGVNVLALTNVDQTGPPDQNIAVGDTQIVEWINSSYAVFDKTTGALIAGPFEGDSLWFGSNGQQCANNPNPSRDIIIQWDSLNHRWLFAYNIPAPPYTVCIAVSQTADATGSYYLYQFPLAANQIPDYPKWGIWTNAYYQTTNNYLVHAGLPFTGAYPCAYNSAKMIVGDPSAEQICFQLSSSDFGLLPGDIDSATPPPANQDEFFIGGFLQGANNNALYLYSLHPDFANPSQSTITGNDASQPITVANFEQTCDGVQYGTTPCVPELNGELLRALGDRLMYRFAYSDDPASAHVGPTAGSVPRQHWVVSHSVEVSGGQAGMRWYEFIAPQHAVPATSLALFQQGTFAPDSNWRWMGSIARDKAGDMLMGCSLSSSTMYPAVAFTGRVPGDPLGTMEGEQIMFAGTGAQVNLSGDWGDYSTVRLDPADGCTFWYVNEYYAVTGTNFDTRLASIKFNTCR